jgi:hypothetical protein
VFVVNEPVGAASFVGLVEPHSGCICSALMHQLCGLADGSVNSLTGGVLNFFALYGALPPAREEKADFCVCSRILCTVHHLFAIRFQLSRFLLHAIDFLSSFLAGCLILVMKVTTLFVINAVMPNKLIRLADKIKISHSMH